MYKFPTSSLSAFAGALGVGIVGCAADAGDPEATGATSQAITCAQQSQQDAHHIFRMLYRLAGAY